MANRSAAIKKLLSEISAKRQEFREKMERFVDLQIDLYEAADLPPPWSGKLKQFLGCFPDIVFWLDTALEGLELAGQELERCQPKRRQEKRNKHVCKLASKKFKPNRIAREMRSSPWPTNERGKPWTPAAISQILKRARKSKEIAIQVGKKNLLPRASIERAKKRLRIPEMAVDWFEQFILDEVKPLSDEECDDPRVIERLQKKFEMNLLRIVGLPKKYIEWLFDGEQS
jgi:hypothetical protein